MTIVLISHTNSQFYSDKSYNFSCMQGWVVLELPSRPTSYAEKGINMWKNPVSSGIQTQDLKFWWQSLWATAVNDCTNIVWSVCRLWAKCGHAVYRQWQCCIVGYYYNGIAAGFADKPPSLSCMTLVLVSFFILILLILAKKIKHL